MMRKFKETISEQMNDAEFKKEYDRLQPEFAIIQAMLDARKAAGLTQKDLAERTGVLHRRT